MGMKSKQKIVEDTLQVKGINNDKKVFDKVSRISGETLLSHFKIELDVNTDIYPMKIDQHYSLCIANSLTADGNDDFDLFRQSRVSGGEDSNNLIDHFHYVMNGKIFEDQISDDGNKLTVFMSFGGLLMSISGKTKDLKDLELDSRVYLLLKQV